MSSNVIAGLIMAGIVAGVLIVVVLAIILDHRRHVGDNKTKVRLAEIEAQDRQGLYNAEGWDHNRVAVPEPGMTWENTKDKGDRDEYDGFSTP